MQFINCLCPICGDGNNMVFNCRKDTKNDYVCFNCGSCFTFEDLFQCSDSTEKKRKVRNIMPDKKPPLGVKPAKMVAWSRIGELAEAIKRQYESGNGKAELCEKWAVEIGWQCALIQSMTEQEDEQNERDA